MVLVKIKQKKKKNKPRFLCYIVFFFREKLQKLDDIKKNIRDAILVRIFILKKKEKKMFSFSNSRQ